MSRRFQFSLKWLFVAILVVAAFFGGMAVQRRLDRPRIRIESLQSLKETMVLQDGSKWERTREQPTE